MLDFVWRICRAPHTDLKGEGARLHGGRWNPPGIPLVYSSSTLSLAALETLVHTDSDLVPSDLVALRIALNGAEVERAREDALLPEWRQEISGSRAQEFGAAWAKQQSSPLLALPSVILPGSGSLEDHEYNVLLNPRHPSAGAVEVVERVAFSFDPRLLEE